MIGIYKFTNKINNKVYVGQSKNIEERYKNHIRSCFTPKCNRYNKYLYKAIRKYGLENFEFEILEECKIEELNEKEMYYISHFNSNDLAKGYNLTNGGDTPSNRFQKAIYQIDMKTKNILNMFDNCYEAAKYINKDPSNIRSCCNGKYKYAYGYIWSYVSEYSKDKYDTFEYNFLNANKKKKNKVVYQFDKNTKKLINKYINSNEASIQNNCSRGAIVNNLVGLSNSSNGYIWSYKESL